MTATEIISIKDYGTLFKESTSVEATFKQLAKEYHPDLNSDPLAKDAFVNIKELYEEAKQAISAGTWKIPGIIQLRDISDKLYQVSYKTHHAFDLGDYYISDTVAAYVIRAEYKDLVANARQTIANFKFSSDSMKAEFARYLPQIIKEFETPTDQVVIIRKTPDLVLLADVIDKISLLKDRDRHVAWIISTLLNLNCYLEYANISHNDISLNTYFISPQFHSGALLGGWWYVSNIGSKLKAVPPSTFSLLHPKVVSSKLADRSINQEMVRALGRELLGNSVGIKLKGTAPEPMIDWLRTSFSGSTFEDYKLWDEVLRKSFGARRFVEMKI